MAAVRPRSDRAARPRLHTVEHARGVEGKERSDARRADRPFGPRAAADRSDDRRVQAALRAGVSSSRAQHRLATGALRWAFGVRRLAAALKSGAKAPHSKGPSRPIEGDVAPATGEQHRTASPRRSRTVRPPSILSAAK